MQLDIINNFIEKLASLMPQFIYILEGLKITLQFSLIGVFFGYIIGFILAILKVSDSFTLKTIAKSYTSIFRGTPLIMQISIFYFAFPPLIGVKLSVFTVGIIAFSLNSGAYVSEIIRSGIESVDQGQIDAAKALDIPPILRMKDIILPQALRRSVPALANEFINLIKESALISTIGGMDIMRRAQSVAAETYDFFTPMIIATLIYYFIVMIVSILAKHIENRLSL